MELIAPRKIFEKFFKNPLTNPPKYDIIYTQSRREQQCFKKNIDKQKRKQRKLWNGYYTRVTPTKADKIDKINKKYKKRGFEQ